MNVAFLQKFWEELTGPLILADLLERQGHVVKFFLPQAGWFENLARFRPQVLAFTLCTGEHQWVLRVAERAKKTLPGPPLVVLGGPHPTFFPEIIQHPSVDAICRGEGEIAFPRFLEACEGNGLPTDIDNFWVKKQGHIFKNPMGRLVRDLDSLPILRRTTLYDDYPFLRTSPYKKTITSRGCPFNCNYCFNHVYKKMVKGKGPYIRRRSVDHVVEEVRYVKERFGVKFMDFADDIFILDRSWILEFAQKYRSVNVPYGCNIHVGLLDDTIAEALKSSGCRIVKFGLETANETIRQAVLNKKTTNGQIRRACQILHQHKLMFQPFNVLGFPGESIEDGFETIHFNQEIKPFHAWCSIAQPLPGTKLAQMCEEKGLVTKQAQEKEYPTSWFDTSILQIQDKSAIINLHKFFPALVRFPWLEPLVRVLIQLPPNALFRLWYHIFYGLHMRHIARVSWWRAFVSYWKLRKQY